MHVMWNKKKGARLIPKDPLRRTITARHCPRGGLFEPFIWQEFIALIRLSSGQMHSARRRCFVGEHHQTLGYTCPIHGPLRPRECQYVHICSYRHQTRGQIQCHVFPGYKCYSSPCWSKDKIERQWWEPENPINTSFSESCWRTHFSSKHPKV